MALCRCGLIGMKQQKLTPVNLIAPGNIEWLWMENGKSQLSNEKCPNAIYVPVDTENLPQDSSECAVQIYQSEQEARFAAQQQQAMSEFDKANNSAMTILSADKPMKIPLAISHLQPIATKMRMPIRGIPRPTPP